MKQMILPDYNNSIVNLMSSIRKYFDLDYEGNTLDIVDTLLKKNNPKNVVVILYDGMGSRLVKRNLDGNSFLNKNMISELSTVVPSTTTAATTSVLTGLYPNSHGYLGWDMYYEKEDKVVIMFTNNIKDTDIKVFGYNIAKKYFPYETITDSINKNGKYYSNIVSPFGGDIYSENNIDEMFTKIENNLNKKEKNYIYAYYTNPDSIMHHTGTDSNEAIECFKMINDKTESFSSKLKDTMLIVIVDHGHINCDEILLEDYPDLYNLLDGDTWIEPRMCAFKIKNGMDEEFKYLFNKYLGKYFVLKSKEEIIREKLFGIGKDNKYFTSLLGDYHALAVSNKYLRYRRGCPIHISTHAGFTIDEMKVPLIIVIRGH